MCGTIVMLSKIIKLLKDVMSVIEAGSRYSGCVDIKYNDRVTFKDGIIEVNDGDVYIITPYVSIHCRSERCVAVVGTKSYLISEDRVEIVHPLKQYYGIWRRGDLEMLLDALERIKDGLELAIRELESGVEQLKAILAEAKLLCS
jgi:hypothetical protein